jgi:hypothetical protein
MNPTSPEFPWATALVVVIVLIASLAGAGVVVFGDSGALSFNDYLDYMTKFVIGLGILGVGRGIRAGMKSRP